MLLKIIARKYTTFSRNKSIREKLKFDSEEINFHPNENKIPSEGKINLFRKEQ